MTVVPAGRGPEISGTAFLFVVLTTIAISLRCYCRIFVVKNFGLDDWFAVIAWVLFIFYSTFSILGVYHGSGQHVADLPLAEIPVGLKWWWSCEPVYVLANMALKLSIGIFLLRIAVSKTHKAIIYGVVGVAEAYGAAYFFIFVLQCRPSAYFWTKYTGGEGTCINASVVVDATYIYSALTCAGDWIFGLLPIFLVWNLQMNPRTKLSVALILAVGAVASTATIIRIPYIKNMDNIADFLYATTDVAIWSTVETGIGITASAVATLRPIFKTFFARSKLMGASTSQGGTGAWGKSNNAAGGYIRSRSRGGIEEFGLTTPAGKNVGVTTVVETDIDLERQDDKHAMSSRRKAEPAGPLGTPDGWNTSEGKMAAESSDEDVPSWGLHGIVKTSRTTVLTQAASR